jgi:hypothetical protein
MNDPDRLASTEDRLAALEDRAAILELHHRYGHLTDYGARWAG